MARVRRCLPMSAALGLLILPGLAFAHPSPDPPWGEGFVSGVWESVGRSKARMGVELLLMTPELRAYFGVEPDVGVLVTKVEPDSPAAEAGIQVGDVIRKADEESIHTPRDLVRLVGGFPKDKELKIELSRKGKEREYELVLHGRPRTSYWQGEEIFGPRLHGAFRELRDQMRELERRLGVLEERSDQE